MSQDNSIPIVDIGPISLQNDNLTKSDFKATGSRLSAAFASRGFAYLTNHGLPCDLPEEAFRLSRDFFEEHSEEEKSSVYPYDPVNLWGYKPPGKEMLGAHKKDEEEEEGKSEMTKTTFLHEYREALDVTRLDSCDKPLLPTDKLTPGLTQTFARLRDAFIPLTLRILRSISIAADIDPDRIAEMHSLMLKEGNRSDIRSLYYPPIKGSIPAGTTRCGEHFDYGTLTFLVQECDDEVGGLEVKSKDRGWIKAMPVPGAILVNIGDELEILSNGLFRATPHRVVIPECQTNNKSGIPKRQSIGFFANTDDKVLLEPIFGMDHGQAKKYDPVTSKDHMDRLCRITHAHLYK